MRFVIAANTISQLVGKIIGAGTTFFISIFLARQFGVAGYGDFIKVTTFIAFFFLIVDFGLNAIYLQRQKDPNAFTTLFGTRVVGGFSLIFLSLAVLAFLPRGQSQGYTDAVRLGIILFSPAILFQALITTANAVFQKHLRYDLATVALGAGSISSLGLLVILARLPGNASIIGSLVLLVGSITTSLVALFFVKRLETTISFSFSPARMMSLFLAATPLGLTLLFNLVYGHVDSVILTLTRSTTEVGVYGLAYKVFELGLVFPTFFMNAVYPLMLKGNFRSLAKKSFFFLGTVSCLLSFVLWFLAPNLSLIQEGFAASAPVLRVLSLSLPFFFISALTMWTLIALRKQVLLLGIYGCAMLINVLLNVWLIPIWGYMAAAWITVVSEGLVLLASAYALYHSYRWGSQR